MSSPLPHYQTKSEKNQYDWISLTKQLYKGKYIILLSIVCGGLIGLLFALTTPSQYTATAIMVPQTTSGNQSQLSGLASLAGINLNLSESAELSPVIYPRIVNSIPFKLELMNTAFTFSDYKSKITIYEYYTGNKPVTVKDTSGSKPVSLDESQILVKKKLDKNIFLDIDKKDGFLTLKVTMPEAIAAAEVAMKVQQLLQRDIIKFKTEKAQADLDFIQERYNVVKAEAESYQVGVAAGADRFKDLVSGLPKVSNARLQTKYTIANSVFQELAKQLEQAKIQVKKDTPVFTVIEPVSIPYEKTGRSKIFILALWLFVGTLAGVFIVFLKQNMANIKKRWNEDRS